MGRRDIETWIATTEGPSDDEAEGSGAEGWENARDDWDSFMKIAPLQLLSSSTKARIDFIESTLIPLSKHAGEPLCISLSCM